MQDPTSNPNQNHLLPNPNHNSNANANAVLPHNNGTPPPAPQPPHTTSSMFGSTRGGTHHRRAHSEVSFRLTDDMADLSPFNGCGGGGGGGGSSTASLEEMGSEDDLFSTYIDVDKLGADQSGGEGNGVGGGGERSGSRARHRHSCSVDGSSTTTSSTGVFGEIMEAKKAMPADKLAELWNLDPKRAKRSLSLSLSAFSYLKFQTFLEIE